VTPKGEKYNCMYLLALVNLSQTNAQIIQVFSEQATF